MSIHPSLTTPEKDKKARSVLKRAERLKILMEKGLWKEGQNIFALPKIKILRITKVKKEKAAPAAAAVGTEGEGETAPTEETKETKTAPPTEKPTKPTKPSPH